MQGKQDKKICSIAVRAAMDLLKDTCSSENLLREVGKILGLTDEDLDKINPPSEHCKEVLESLDAELCRSFRGIRSWVMCRAWELMDSEGLSFSEAMRTAWMEAREKCAKKGVIV